MSIETASAGGEKAKTRSSCGAENSSLEAGTESLGVFEENTGVCGRSCVSKSSKVLANQSGTVLACAPEEA